MSSSPHDLPFVSRGGLKLAAALDAFELDVAGFVCADLGCSTGGFTDCLLQRGASHVYAVDTAYGQLAWKLRQDERVTVLERTNALHFDPRERLGPQGFRGCDLVVLDLGWTVQAKAVPAALRWLKRNEPTAGIVSLVKPQYEATHRTRGRRLHGPLDREEADAVLADVLGQMPGLGVEPVRQVISPIRGGKGGNVEYLVWLKRIAPSDEVSPGEQP